MLYKKCTLNICGSRWHVRLADLSISTTFLVLPTSSHVKVRLRGQFFCHPSWTTEKTAKPLWRNYNTNDVRMREGPLWCPTLICRCFSHLLRLPNLLQQLTWITETQLSSKSEITDRSAKLWRQSIEAIIAVMATGKHRQDSANIT